MNAREPGGSKVARSHPAWQELGHALGRAVACRQPMIDSWARSLIDGIERIHQTARLLHGAMHSDTLRAMVSSQSALDIPEDSYKADLELLDRYLAFSSEILRVALLGVAAVAFFVEKYASAFAFPAVRTASLIGVCALGSSAVFALAHRYCSTDGFHYHLRAARRLPAKAGRRTDSRLRSCLYRVSGYFLLLAVAALCAGTMALVVAFWNLLALLPSS